MKFLLFCVIVGLLVDVCRTRRTIKDLLARNRKRRAVPGPYIDLMVRSEGCNDPGKTPPCGIAYIKVNGKDHSLRRRGHNVVVVDATIGVVLEVKSFDTHGDGTAGNRLRDYLNSIHGDKIVLVAIQDAGSNHGPAAFDALRRLGATDPILNDFRGSYALVGYARENKPSWIAQQQAHSGQGPSEISLKVPLIPYPFVDVHVRSEGCEDPGKAPGTCGIAYLNVDGRDHSLHRRGYNVVVVDATTGAVLGAVYFDTHGDGTAGNRLRDYLNAQTGEKIVLVGIQDEGLNQMRPAGDALKRVGAVDPVVPDYRGSFALIGHANANVLRPLWIAQKMRPRTLGPSEISSRIPLTPSRPPSMDIHIRSEGCNDPEKTPNTCGIAYIYVNGEDHSVHGRGHNVVVVDDASGAVLETKRFDTHGDPAAGNQLRDYLNSINGNKIVLVAVQDEGAVRMHPAIDALKRVGAVDPVLVDYRGSFALVGHPRTNKPPWITQQRRNSGQGPSEIYISIPLSSNCLGALGMQNLAISDGQLKASSEWDGYLSIAQGRLHHPRSWSARTNDVNQWYQIDLGSKYTKVTGTATQGRGDHPQWVIQYKLQYSNDETHFKYYREHGQAAVKEFAANSDQHTVVYHALNPPVMARYIRFQILAWHGHISMRAEVYGCPGCRQALGMENYAIPDGQISASSQWDGNHAAIQGRLHFTASGNKQGGWSSRTNDVNQWLQVDLGDMYIRVTRVGSQGRNNADQWVTKYKLQYSEDGVNFQYFKEEGKSADKEFGANSDRNTVVHHTLNPAITARYFRFQPLAWHNHISMRIEIYGCPDCQEAIGMENYAIADNQISASSQWDANHAAIQGRLHFRRSGSKQGAWSSRTNDVNQWLQINLNKYTRVTHIASQGRDAANQWVTKYKLQYSNDGVNFQYYKEQGQSADKEFAGNSDQNTIVYHTLNSALEARYVRFRPATWHGHISMRVELYGCPAPDPCLSHGCQNGATCVNLDGGYYRCECTSEYTGNYCETVKDACASGHGCQNGATCVNLDGGNYRCDCASGYTGNYCQTDINECASVTCQHGGTCVDLVGSYRCVCVTGYSGNHCETDINECASVTCQHGGTCVDLVGSYRCNCVTGYSGSHCETDINECASVTCQHGGACVDLVGSYRCDCVTGYSGNHCETDINECASVTCQHGGTCADLVGSYRCDCVTGYSGNHCETDINECASVTCQHGGTCVDLVGSYRCACVTGYSGNHCETNINECASVNCQYGGTCVDLVGSYRCDCVTGYSGNHCETDINECAPAPCKNGATCVDLVGSYRCDCAAGWFGSTCEEPEIDECED